MVWAALDQSRWQPYFVQYMLFLALVLGVPWERRGTWQTAELEDALRPMRLFLAFTYLYSGLQKLNHTFVTGLFPWCFRPLAGWFGVDLDQAPATAVAVFALGSAVAESVAGVGLLLPRTRCVAALVLAAMHVAILLAVGPLGHNRNVVIWPWNVALIAALLLLFLRRGEPSPSAEPPTSARAARAAWATAGLRAPSTRRSRHALATAGVILGFGVLPALSFVDRWDSYLSFSLYSGNTREARLHVDPLDRDRLPSAARAVLREDGWLDLFDWSERELGATSYPEDRVALHIGRTVARRVTSGDVLLRLEGKPHPITGVRSLRFVRCPRGGGPPEEVEIWEE
jgi:uncharacterized membrane protein YphA (DoxX/SURF4 family)